jgi:hypothetical protein
MGNYSDRVGSAQALSNGNYSFTSGAQGSPPFIGQSIEVLPDGSKTYVLQVGRGLYRSYRTRTLYQGIDDVLAGKPQTVQSVVLNDGSAQRSMVNQITVTSTVTPSSTRERSSCAGRTAAWSICSRKSPY